MLVKFEVDKSIRLGDRTEAAIKTKSILGAKMLELTPRGDGRLSGPIPLDRTTSPYQLPDALGDLSTTISGLDTNRLSDSLAVLADTFSDTPAALKIAIQGVARFSQTLNDRDAQLRNLLTDANKATAVLAERSDHIVRLITDTNALLTQLKSQSRALDQISDNISAVSRQIKGLIAENRQTLKPALDKLNEVLTILDDRKERVQLAIKGFNHYAMSLGESMSSGPFFKFYIANLLPGQFIQPFVDAAFSDLGLDPNVCCPRSSPIRRSASPARRPCRCPSPHRPGRRAEAEPARRDHRQPGRSALSLPGADAGAAPGRAPAGTAAAGSRQTPAPDAASPSPVYVPAPGEPPNREGRPMTNRTNARVGLAAILVPTLVAGVAMAGTRRRPAERRSSPTSRTATASSSATKSASSG